MRKDNITEDFDLFVKGSLLNAEETPSPRVWQAIESRLPAAETAPVVGGFRWGWLAVAAAAAVAAILAIPSNSNLNNINSAQHSALAQASPVEVAAIPAPREINVPARRTSAPAQASVAVVPVADVYEAEVSGTEPATAQQSSQAQQTSGQNQAEISAKNDGLTAKSGTNGSAVEPTADPFAVMAAEDAQKAGKRGIRTSLWLGGAMGGNESSSGGAAYAAKSANPAYIENVITENSASNYGIPVSVGLGVRLGLSEKLSASAGIDYSLLTRSFSGLYSPAGETPANGDINQTMRYAGIPVGLYYNVLGSGSLKFHLLGMGEVEFCLGNSYNIRSKGITVSEKVAGPQFSAGAGFGVDFALTPHLSIYVDPTVRYYFESGHPNSIRTEKPLMLNFNAGLRFNL